VRPFRTTATAPDENRCNAPWMSPIRAGRSAGRTELFETKAAAISAANSIIVRSPAILDSLAVRATCDNVAMLVTARYQVN
jgi:hypothetical protein